jgi:hypothetical protein
MVGPADSVQIADEHLARDAERAGAALACPYSSSAEMEAAIIRERRAAGAYAVPLHRRPLSWAVGLAFLLGLILLAD